MKNINLNKSFLIILLMIFAISCGKESDMGVETPKNSPSEGKSGSTARIVVKGNFIYAIDNHSLKVIDISVPDNPNYIKTVDVGFGIETIYPFKDYLFIGSTIGMYIYSLSSPESPQQLSEFEHVTSCDPVIANDSLAFVTLRYNEVCRGFQDVRQIDVIDVTSVINPNLIRSYITAEYPYGLDIDSNRLYVCHGDKGIIIYDVNDLMTNTTAEIGSISGITAYDAVFYNNILFVIGESGFYQYDYSNFNNITLISSILAGQ
ncbi:LVIVD repeat-containing protein [Bacteroidota bacterium]